MQGACATQWGTPAKSHQVELDHVENAGLGRRGPSTAANLVSLCGYHHRMKTEASRTWKPKLREYLEECNAKSSS